MIALDYEFYMHEALQQARHALALNDVPIGCVIVYEGRIIGKGYNRRTHDKNALHHAEILAIGQACTFMGDWRLEGATLFVTIEPCPMCAGAIIQARIKTVVYGAANKKAGCAGSVLNILNHNGFNHQAETVPGVLGEACADLMRTYFSTLRQTREITP